jgi:2-methylcitrate dehydratase PrpD
MRGVLDISEEFATHVANTRYEALPHAAAEAAKKSLLDTIGVILAASGMEQAVRPVVDLARESGHKGESLLLGFGERIPVAAAALANGAMAHCLDFDDRTTWGAHSGSSLIPAVLSVAENRGGISGKRLIAAIAIGQDIFVRLRCSVLDDHQWNLSTVMGIFSAVAGASHVLGLSRDQIVNAFGIASIQSSGTMQAIYSGSHLRGMYAGFSANAAVVAVLLAEKGLTGVRDSFEGKAGVLPMYFGEDYDRERMLAGLGQNYLGANMLYKPWPVVGLAHTYIHATIQLMARHALVAGDIEEIRVYVADRQMEMCVPIERRRSPETAVDAKFSLPFCVALAAVKGEIKIKDFTPAALCDRDVLAMSARVVPIGDDSAEVTSKMPVGRVAIVTRNGKEFEQLGSDVPGSADAPLDWDAVTAKFIDCANAAAVPVATSAIARAVQLVTQLEDIEDVTALVRTLAGSDAYR